MTAHVPPGGPYCDVDMRRWWVAVEDCGYLDARRLVKATADIDRYSRLQYVGKERAHLWDDEGCEGHDDEEYPEDGCDGCRRVMAWGFEVIER